MWLIGGLAGYGCGPWKEGLSRKGGLPHEASMPKRTRDHATHPPGGGAIWPGEADA